MRKFDTSKLSVPPCSAVPPERLVAASEKSSGAFDVLLTTKAVTAASWPGDTWVVALPSSATVKLTLRSTVKLLLAETLFWETPPTWKLTVTLLVIVEPAVVPAAKAGAAVPAATANRLAAALKRAIVFMVYGPFFKG